MVFDEHSFPAKELEVFNSLANHNSRASKSLIIPTSVMSSSLLSLPNFTNIQSQPPTSDPASLSPVLHIPDIPPPSNLEPSPSHLEPIPATHTYQPVVTTIQTHSKISHSRPKQYLDYQLFYSTRHPLQAFSAFHAIVEPTCYTKATLDS